MKLPNHETQLAAAFIAGATFSSIEHFSHSIMTHGLHYVAAAAVVYGGVKIYSSAKAKLLTVQPVKHLTAEPVEETQTINLKQSQNA